MPIIVQSDAPAGAPFQTSTPATMTPVQRAIAAISKPQQPEVDAPVASPAEDAPATQSAAETTPAQEPALSPKLVELARREKAFVKRQLELKAREDALAAKESEYKSSYINKSQLAANPVQALLEAGLTHDQIMQQLLNGNAPVDPAIASVQAEIKALKDAQEQAKLQATESQKRQYENAIGQIRSDVKSLVDTNPEFESIKALDASEAVVKLIEKQFEKDGTLLSNEDAAKQVEEYLIEEAMKMAGLSKVRSRLNPITTPGEATPEAAKQRETPKVVPVQAPIKTLTNAATAAPSRALNEKDRRARAIAAFQGQLK